MNTKKTALIIISLLFPLLLIAQSGKVKRTIISPGYTATRAAVITGLNTLITPDEVIVKINDHTGHSLELVVLDLSSNLQRIVTITLEPYSFYSISTTNIAFSAVNIPFKIRSKIDSAAANVETAIENIGLFIGRKREAKRYFYSGKETVHSISAGFFLSPTAIELKAGNTNGEVTEEISQFGLSTGIGLSYTYNKVTFMIIPIGFDIGLSSKTDKWIYDKKYWFGFGFGFDLGLFN